MKRVRLVDVAEVAGVSTKTVSNVVHDYPHVAPELRRRVQAAIDKLGYRPNLTARRLVTGRTGMIALAIPEIDHPYFSELSRQIAEEAARRNYRVIIEQTLGKLEAEHAVLEDREAGLVDGIIFHPVSIGALSIAKLHHDTPLVLLGEGAMPATSDHVMIDNVAAAAEAVKFLLRQGRRRIAFLGVVEDDVTFSTDKRLLGYQQGLIEAGLDPDPGLVLSVRDFSSEASGEAVRAALQRGISIDGIVCRDDKFAAGALRACAAAGMPVPDGIAVLGWDDTAIGEYTTPSLTSVAPDKSALASTALELLTERIDGFRGVGRHRIVPHGLTIRQSTPSVSSDLAMPQGEPAVPSA
jgi:DNA-binding LacI/PurR family transcriptional regulator